MKLKTLALGAAGGYALCRAYEARAVGLPLGEAFKLANILKPVSAIRALLPSSQAMAVTAANQPQVIDVTPVG